MMFHPWTHITGDYTGIYTHTGFTYKGQINRAVAYTAEVMNIGNVSLKGNTTYHHNYCPLTPSSVPYTPYTLYTPIPPL